MARFYPLVVLKWIDHVSSNEWVNSVDEADKLLDLSLIVSAGYLLIEDEKSYLLCMNLSPDNYSCMMRILKSDVVEYKETGEVASLDV